VNFDVSQRRAIEAVLTKGDWLITGGAGTGKSSLIKAIADAYNGACSIMAPTGKAAARLKEVTGYPAYTIHRMLMYDGAKFNRPRHQKFTEPVIIDEASMMDSYITARLLEYTPAKLILVGDAAQLPPVGRGAPFHSLLKLRPERVCELTHCWRAQGAVHIAAQQVRQGVTPKRRLRSGGESFSMIPTGKAEPTAKQLIAWTEEGYYDPIPSKENGFTPDIMLAPRYGDKSANDDGKQDGGIHAINRSLRAILNPSEEPFAVNDRVICNKNFSELDLWNGDLGTVSDIDVDGQLYVDLDRDPGRPRLCGKEEIRELSHAYCLSVHKAQGSQFRRVFFICLWSHHRMLERSLIYTAITRAREGIVVCGQPEAFKRGLAENRTKRTVMGVLGMKA